jgi:hypothetical protein
MLDEPGLMNDEMASFFDRVEAAGDHQFVPKQHVLQQEVPHHASWVPFLTTALGAVVAGVILGRYTRSCSRDRNDYSEIV